MFAWELIPYLPYDHISFLKLSWSSKCTPAAPAFMNFFVNSNTFKGPPNPASPSAIIGNLKSTWSFSLLILPSQ